MLQYFYQTHIEWVVNIGLTAFSFIYPIQVSKDGKEKFMSNSLNMNMLSIAGRLAMITGYVSSNTLNEVQEFRNQNGIMHFITNRGDYTQRAKVFMPDWIGKIHYTPANDEQFQELLEMLGWSSPKKYPIFRWDFCI